MIKTRLRALLALSLGVSVVAVLAFVNNVVAIIRWWRGFLAAGRDSAAFAADEVCGPISWLNWSAVDYSAVTTFIPALGFCCLSVALFRLVRGRVVRAEDFPFFRGSDQLNVALGLFGTLWGIIVIGYFRLDTVSMADLMQCLHTALFSTLAAVVWVFMIDRPLVRPYFQRLAARAGLVALDSTDLAGAVDHLVERLHAASETFEARQRQFDAAYDERQRNYELAYVARQSATEKDFAERQASYEKTFAERQAASDKTFAERQAASDKTFAERQASYEKSFAERLAAFEQAAHARQTAYEESFERRLADYQKDFETRQEEYRSFFQRRIDELQHQAAEEKARADRLAAKLAAVTDALR